MKYKLSLQFVEMVTDLDWHALDSDPAIFYRSNQIRIHNNDDNSAKLRFRIQILAVRVTDVWNMGSCPGGKLASTSTQSQQISSTTRKLPVIFKIPSQRNPQAKIMYVYCLLYSFLHTPMYETKIKNQKECHRPSNISKIMPVCITFIKISKIFLSNDIIT
jgi:hypothetical protein